MKHFYSEVDGVTLTYNDLRRVGNVDVIPVYFERLDGKDDFDFAEGTLPYLDFPRSRGFSELELEQMRNHLRNNMLLIYDAARGLD